MNIFAKKDAGSGEKQSKRKKRNLFMSENVWVDEDDGIPEENSYSSI